MTTSHSSISQLCNFLFNSTDKNLCRKWLGKSISHCQQNGWIDKSWFRSKSLLSEIHSIMFIEDHSKKLTLLRQATKLSKSDCNRLYNIVAQDYLNNHQSHLEAKVYLAVLVVIAIVLSMILFYVWRKNIKRPECTAKVSKRVVRMPDKTHLREKSFDERNKRFKSDADQFMNPQRVLPASGTPCLPVVLPDKRTLANYLIPQKLKLDGKIKSRTDSDFRWIAVDKLLSVLDQSDKQKIHLTLVTLDEPVYDQEEDTINDKKYSKDPEVKACSTQRIDKPSKSNLSLNASPRCQKDNDKDSKRNIADAAVQTASTMVKSDSPEPVFEKTSSPKSILKKPTEQRDASPKGSPRHVSFSLPEEFVSAESPNKSALTPTRASYAGSIIAKPEPYRRNTMSELYSHKKSVNSSAQQQKCDLPSDAPELYASVGARTRFGFDKHQTKSHSHSRKQY